MEVKEEPEPQHCSFVNIAWVQDVAVVGVPDLTWGQKVGAVVVTAPGSELNLSSLRSAIGIYDLNWGQKVGAVVVTVPGTQLNLTSLRLAIGIYDLTWGQNLEGGFQLNLTSLRSA